MRKMLGFFYLLILTVLVFFTIYLQGWNPFAERQVLTVVFPRVEGLRDGDDVKVEGVVLGKVETVTLSPTNGVRVTLRLDEPIQIFKNYDIRVEALSLLGGNYVTVRRGTPESGAVEVGPDTVLQGKAKPSAFDQLGEMVEENRDNLQAFMTNASQAFGEIKTAVASINEGQGTMGRLMKDPSLYDKATSMFARAEEAITGLRSDMGEVVRKIDQGEGALPALLNDKQMKDELKATTANIKKISEDLSKVTDKLAKGEGTLGKLFMEEKLYQDAEKTLEGVDSILGRAGRSKVFVVGESKSYDESEMSITKIGIRIMPDETKYIYAGAAFLSMDAEGPVRFEKQVEEGDDDTEVVPEALLMYRLPWALTEHVGLKAGLLEGKGGGGIEIDFDLFEGYPLHVDFEIRDAYSDLADEDIDEEIDGPMTRLWAKAPLWARGEAWYEQILSSLKIFGGMARLQDDPEWFVGIGFEYRDEDIKSLVGLLSAGR